MPGVNISNRSFILFWGTSPLLRINIILKNGKNKLNNGYAINFFSPVSKLSLTTAAPLPNGGKCEIKYLIL